MAIGNEDDTQQNLLVLFRIIFIKTFEKGGINHGYWR